MTDPIHDPISLDPFSHDPISPDPFSPDPITPEASSTTAAESPTATVPAKDSALTPLYAAAGLAEVVATQLRTRLSRGQAQSRALPDPTKGRVAELQQQLKSYLDQVTRGYNSLATRGKPTVDSTLVTVKHLSGRAERKVEDVKSDVVDSTKADVPDHAVVQPVIVPPVVDVDAAEPDLIDPNRSWRDI